MTEDENGENPVWLRSAKLTIDRFGFLCAHVDGKLRPLDPPINVPSDWTQISIDASGSVTIANSVSPGQSIGTMSVCLFAGDVENSFSRLEDPADRFGPPTVVDTPGNNGAGYVIQGTIAQYYLPVTIRTCVAMGLFVSWMTGWMFFTRRDAKARIDP